MASGCMVITIVEQEVSIALSICNLIGKEKLCIN